MIRLHPGIVAPENNNATRAPSRHEDRREVRVRRVLHLGPGAQQPVNAPAVSTITPHSSVLLIEVGRDIGNDQQ